jgi:hypothetical protein
MEGSFRKGRPFSFALTASGRVWPKTAKAGGFRVDKTNMGNRAVARSLATVLDLSG